jgi:uncharacterized protein YggU (UPF0235/DUF167 family)
MYIKVKVAAGARNELLEPMSKDAFKVSVREPAERNLANGRVIELIALHFKIPSSHVRIVNGHHSPSKILSVRTEPEKGV